MGTPNRSQYIGVDDWKPRGISPSTPYKEDLQKRIKTTSKGFKKNKEENNKMVAIRLDI